MGGVKNPLSNVDFTKPISEGPIARGFDHYFGTIVPNYLPTVSSTMTERWVYNSAKYGGSLTFRVRWYLNGSLRIFSRAYEHAVEWIEETSQTKKPFFLYLSLTSPHYPVVPSSEFVGKTQVGTYGDFVYQTDWSVGQVLDALERSGVADNTLVIFTSDNGAEVTGEVKAGCLRSRSKVWSSQFG